MESRTETNEPSVIERIVAHAAATVPDRPGLANTLRGYFAHVDPADLLSRQVADLFGMAADHLQLAAGWSTGSVAIEVSNPRIDVDGWESDHTIVRIVTDDIPFLVDSVSVELSRHGIGIHSVTHPVMYRSDADGSFVAATDAHHDERLVSLISIEIDRQASAELRTQIEHDLRRVLDDVRAAVRDRADMQARMIEVSEFLVGADLPVDRDEIDETRELLDWLAADHFVFIGARDYELVEEDGEEKLRIVPGSGLGVLEKNIHLGRARPLSELAPAARARVHEPRLLNLTKTTSVSTVHRAAFLDYVGVKTFDERGAVNGERRFLGLFTSDVYNRSVENVPRARRTAAAVVRRADFSPGGHDEKRLKGILERYPRDDLLQMDVDELYDIALGIAGLQERRRVRMFARRELFGRFVTVLVFLPRDRYNTSVRTGIEQILRDGYGGTLADWDAEMSESVLARLRFVFQVGADTTAVDTADLEARVESLIHMWADGLTEALIHSFGDDEALPLGRSYSGAFSLEFQRAFDPRTAAFDIEQIEALERHGSLRLNAYREPGSARGAFKLKLYRRGEPVSLTAVMPSLTNLGVTVADERPYEIRPKDHDPVWIYDFALEHHGNDLDFARASELFEEAFAAVWAGMVEDDGFNRLVLGAGMPVADVAILRAYARYLRQVGLGYSRLFVERALEEHPTAARRLVELFSARFHPDDCSADEAARIETDLEESIGAIESLDQDRLLRRFLNLIQSTVRTTWAQRDEHGERRPYLAFKLNPMAISEMPEPRPRNEIFVYSPRFEGVHLRGGLVARGGLRWSDRTEDYRTEVLGLVKAQMVKNSVIVPAGAKGGFVLKHRPAPGNELREEVVTCYKMFVSGLLDLTDNLVDDELVPPDRTVRYDGDDSYLVVAADKGTATFSDIANELAQQRGFWLGDAFASGGSHGYDHKQMGITAKGAWESVKRHFRELGRDVQNEAFTVAGIGDMSGDVFGNGMLQSRFTHLIAAFDHRHIFIDPDPNPEASYDERHRLFTMAGSSWDDYDHSLLSAGGGIYERSAKSIVLSAQARRVLGTEAETVTPDELMSVVLRAPVDLFWNGGIGTYVKASTETNADVGDKANDRLRVDAPDLRCAVVGEGGNLGITQRARIEIARAGGRVFTDAIDNAAGVNCSDHEVNIKILLDRVVTNGDLTVKQRNELLEEMTGEVSAMVLDGNYRQALALSAARVDALSLVDVHGRYIEQLQQLGLLDRELEALPDIEDLTERRLAGTGLTTPELAVLMAYSKNTLKADLLASSVPDDTAMVPLLVDYFPTALRDRFADQIAAHPLRREIIANLLANLVVDRAGMSMIYRLGQETSAPATEIAAAHYAAWEIFGLDEIVEAVNSLDGVLPDEKQLAAHLSCRQLAERAARLLVRNRPNPFSAADAIADLCEPVGEALEDMGDHLLGSDAESFTADVSALVAGGAATDLAQRIAGLAPSVAALDIVTVAEQSQAPVPTVSATHFAVADRLDLLWIRDSILALPRDSRWATLARLTLRIDLYSDHRELTRLVMAETSNDFDGAERVDAWTRLHQDAVDRYHRSMSEIRSVSTDITMLLVVARELRNLISRTSVVG